MGARVWVKQQLVRIEAVSFGWLVGAVHAEAVERAGPDVGQKAVKDLVGIFRKFDPAGFLAVKTIENADLNLSSVGREHSEVGAPAVPSRAERVGKAFFDLHCVLQMELTSRPPWPGLAEHRARY